MSELERTMQRAFDAVRLPDDVAVRTLAFIEAARAEEAAAPEAPGETIASSGEPCGIQADGSFAAHAAAAGTPAAGQASPQPPVVTPAVQAAARHRPRRWVRIAVAACLAAALAGGGGVVYASESAYVEISADGTVPSAADAGADGAPAPDGAASGGSTELAVELGLNCFNVVVRATGLNEAGQALLDKVDVVGKSYEEARLIVCHLGGGVSVAAHDHGRVVDVFNVKDEGAMGMDRGGGLPVNQLIDYCYAGRSREEVKRTLGRRSGMLSYVGTTDFREICARVVSGDERFTAAYRALVYQLAKDIGAMAAVLHFEVDAIVYTGGMAYEQFFCDDITAYVGRLAPILRFPGEEEMRALAEGALRVLHGEAQAETY